MSCPPCRLRTLAHRASMVGLLVLSGLSVHAQEAASDAGSARLRRARLQVRVESPTHAEVSAAFELSGGGQLDLLVTSFSGQSLEWIRAEVDGEAFLPAARGADQATVRRIRVEGRDAATRSLYVDYAVTVPEARAYRFPLPVPELSADPEGHSVVVEVELPPGMRYTGDGFPGFDSVSARGDAELLRAATVGVPAFVHVVFSDAAGGWPVPSRLQAAAVALTLLPLVVFALYVRRRAASA